MSSLLLSLSSKHSVLCKISLVISLFFLLLLMSTCYASPQRCHSTVRMFSSSTTTNPYLLYRFAHFRSSPDDLDMRSEIHYFDPVKEDEVIVRDKVFPLEFRRAGFVVGMSHGWGVFKVQCDDYKDRAVYVSDLYNPCGSKPYPKIIPLHRIGQPNAPQMHAVTNAAMTCSPDQSTDFAVAVNTLGVMINFFRPKDSVSLIFDAPFRYFDLSKVMYSKRDDKFYSASIGGDFLISWDSSFEEGYLNSNWHELRFTNLAELTQSEWEILDSCSKTVQLVESPSGQRFLIKWYAQNHKPGDYTTFLCRGTKRFMVFRGEEAGVMSYTEDIGDLCIFLGNSEPFCVKASSFPGLNPNSIYFAGDGCGVYDIATRKPRSFRTKSPLAFSTGTLLPYWIPPMSL